jgi:hypothetical protein
MAKVEFQIAPEKLPQFQVIVRSLNQMAWWGESVHVNYCDFSNSSQSVTLDVRFPPLDEFKVVGWVNHQSGAEVMLLDADEMFEARMHSRKCDLLGRKQSRRETWILVDRSGVLLCCGPAGAGQLHTPRYRLKGMATWLRLLGRVVSKCGGEV